MQPSVMDPAAAWGALRRVAVGVDNRQHEGDTEGGELIHHLRHPPQMC